MNIKGKVKQLEEKLNVSSKVCICFSYKGKTLPLTETYLQDLSHDSTNTEPVLHGEAVPDICPKCGKSVEKQRIIIQFVDASTKDLNGEIDAGRRLG